MRLDHDHRGADHYGGAHHHGGAAIDVQFHEHDLVARHDDWFDRSTRTARLRALRTAIDAELAAGDVPAGELHAGRGVPPDVDELAERARAALSELADLAVNLDDAARAARDWPGD